MESDLKNIDPLFDWLRDIYKAEMQIEKLWLAKFKKPNSVSDKIAKLIEELAEVRQAQKETDPEHELEEIVDSVIAVLTIAYLRGFSPGEVYQMLFKVKQKIYFRWFSETPPLERLHWAKKIKRNTIKSWEKKTVALNAKNIQFM